MRTTQFVAASLVCAAGLANATYSIKNTFDHTNFFDNFDFFTGADPTNGFVSFQSEAAANKSGIAGYSQGAVFMGVDATTVNPEGGRSSVRVSSKATWTKGLFIADIAHMPGAACGIWPAFWTFGPNWPSSGEIDIIEGVNLATTDSITLHTSAGCTMSASGSASSSKLAQGNCEGNTGCSVATQSPYADTFNSGGGGVYAMEWTSSKIAVHYFPRNAIPKDITSGAPNPDSWGTPAATFGGSGCDIDQHFMNHQIIFDTTFCGDWAGEVFSTTAGCSAKASTCSAYVGANPTAFKEAYWMVNSVKVYQDPTAKRDFIEQAFSA